MKICGSRQWKAVTLHHHNALTVHLHRFANKRYQGWNDVVDEIKSFTEPLVTRKLSPVIEEHWLPKAFDNSVRWDVLHAFMELEYADVREPAFFMMLMQWYLRGRFPCGWGKRNSRGRIELVEPVEPEPDFDPEDPKNFVKAAVWPILAAEHDVPAPEGRLIVY